MPVKVSVTNPATAYNGIGRLYNLHWQGVCARLAPAFDRLLFVRQPRGSLVLDLCCGAGHLASALCRRGLRVVALDGSTDMLRFARLNAPRAELVAADARKFFFRERFQAAVSSGDSMNHMLTSEDLRAVFANVFGALAPGGRFAFDMNMAEAFTTQWHKSSTLVGPDHLVYVRGSYRKPDKLGTTEVTLFRMEGFWKRTDLTIYQRCYPLREVCALLAGVGFVDVHTHSGRSLGVKGRLAVGRTFFAARKPA